MLVALVQFSGDQKDHLKATVVINIIIINIIIINIIIIIIIIVSIVSSLSVCVAAVVFTLEYADEVGDVHHLTVHKVIDSLHITYVLPVTRHK